uniref:Uncharacterized protein n=1 Tax=uncultured marine virus TaxID=186617 RepID=A0A0F7L8F6_9VIRU|nr:hypothetical protein [uncultured marine virus]
MVLLIADGTQKTLICVNKPFTKTFSINRQHCCIVLTKTFTAWIWRAERVI